MCRFAQRCAARRHSKVSGPSCKYPTGLLDTSHGSRVEGHCRCRRLLAKLRAYVTPHGRRSPESVANGEAQSPWADRPGLGIDAGIQSSQAALGCEPGVRVTSQRPLTCRQNRPSQCRLMAETGRSANWCIRPVPVVRVSTPTYQPNCTKRTSGAAISVRVIEGFDQVWRVREAVQRLCGRCEVHSVGF
jgi:hypothetical protein